jgi:hypothetical protein
MTSEEKDARIALLEARCSLLEARCRRWFNRARRLVEAISDKDQAWADRILEGWEHDAPERTQTRTEEVKS